jgi:hypothetical protein
MFSCAMLIALHVRSVESGALNRMDMPIMKGSKIMLAVILVLNILSAAVADLDLARTTGRHNTHRDSDDGSVLDEQSYHRRIFESDIVAPGSRGLGTESNDALGAHMLHDPNPKKC